jgi:ADP-ribose pyrophosphatase
MTERGPDRPLADSPADAHVSEAQLLVRGFRPLERFAVTLKHADGSAAQFSRDLLRVGHVVGVLPVDVARAEVVLIRQFRLAAHLRLGKGDFVEIVAGYVDPGEAPAAAARRECLEEIGVLPAMVRELFSFMPAPGQLDEIATIFLASVDASRVPERAGAAHETEDTRPVRVPIETAIAALEHGQVHNGYLIIALQWLALHRDRLGELLKET